MINSKIYCQCIQNYLYILLFFIVEINSCFAEMWLKYGYIFDTAIFRALCLYHLCFFKLLLFISDDKNDCLCYLSFAVLIIAECHLAHFVRSYAFVLCFHYNIVRTFYNSLFYIRIISLIKSVVP